MSIKVAVRGGKPNTELFRNLGDAVYDERKFIKVLPTLQLPQYPSIFALGDIISFNEQKSLAKVPAQASVVLSNVLSLISGKEPKSVYKGSVEGIFITNGKVRHHHIHDFFSLTALLGARCWIPWRAVGSYVR